MVIMCQIYAIHSDWTKLTLFISEVIWNENDVQNNVKFCSEVRSQYETVVRKWKKDQL